MAYESPLVYLLGIEGQALLRSLTGAYGPGFAEARLAEMRRLLDDPALADGMEVERVGTVEGYRAWARTYDGPNAAFELDEPVITEILDGLGPGAALDAACGTGRVAALLAGRGHRVIGVDGSPEMLAKARVRVPEGEFRAGGLDRLPVGDDAVDLVVCALALTHVPDLRPVLAEFARVLRPGGHLVTSDMHPEAVARGKIPSTYLPDGRPGRIASHRHPLGTYVRAALAAGFQVRRCEEPTVPRVDGPPEPDPGPWEVWPWSVADLIPEAAEAARTPAELIWHFQLPAT